MAAEYVRDYGSDFEHEGQVEVRCASKSLWSRLPLPAPAPAQPVGDPAGAG